MRLRAVVLAIVAAAAIAPAGAHAAGVATPAADSPPPALTIPQAKLDATIKCGGGDLAATTRAPVLFVQGTGATADENWSWNYEKAMPTQGIAWCHVDVPMRAQGDLQDNAQYVVSAIRFMHAKAGRKISIIGHSQGGMSPRWALRWYPDTRAMVDDLIGFAPSNHGTTQADMGCRDADGCSPSGWQQNFGSNFITALNTGPETWPGISYTSVYTRLDEIVQPNADAKTGSSSLRTGDGRKSNIATQDICPTDFYEHLSIGTVDPVAYALAIDALGHDGPADAARIDRAVCAQVLMPGINPATATTDIAGAVAGYEIGEGGAGNVPVEPPLRCYVTASCPAGVPPTAVLKPLLVVSVTPRRVHAGRSVRLAVQVRYRAVAGARLAAVRRALVQVGSKRARTSVSGRASVRTTFTRTGRVKVRVSAAGYRSRSVFVRVVR
jgi:hypothetical protein